MPPTFLGHIHLATLKILLGVDVVRRHKGFTKWLRGRSRAKVGRLVLALRVIYIICLILYFEKKQGISPSPMQRINRKVSPPAPPAAALTESQVTCCLSTLAASDNVEESSLDICVSGEWPGSGWGLAGWNRPCAV